MKRAKKLDRILANKDDKKSDSEMDLKEGERDTEVDTGA